MTTARDPGPARPADVRAGGRPGEAFDLRAPLPTGTTLLEASAGTGKTFTIAALTTRYVAEGVASLSQVMLVTFGSAASRELRDRVRERLTTAELALRDPGTARRSSDALAALLAEVPDEEAAVRRERLVRALASFDEATIATTHSFCSQMLAGLGLAADTDPSATFTESVDDLVEEVVDDLYLRAYARPGADVPPFSHADLLELGRRAVGSDRSARLWPVGGEGVPAARRAAAQKVRDEVALRKRRLGLVDYEDWLVLLRDALADPEHGETACARVRARFRVVLVDEFQDTDPVQWEVLRRAFHGSTALVLIGDPKQAVYAFRGGDVTTYLAAREVATSEHTLTRNWRSDGDLLDGLDLLLGAAALGDPRIVVRPVQTAHPGRRLTGAGAPVRLRQVGRRGHGPLARGLPKVTPVRAAVARDVAADVVRLLSGPARYEGRPVRPDDVAVLVRTNRQGSLVHEALAAAGVPAVLAGGGSVFLTRSAREWLVLLEAVEQPHRAGRVRAAALTVFLGETTATLDAGGDGLTDQVALRMRRWSELLDERGVAALFEVLAAQEGLPARVLAAPDGERVLTDLRHVAQALHAAATQDGLGLTALVAWLRRRIARAAVEGTDERTRRLDSDAHAVQIMTVHVSKGLEFPVVHVPYAWDRWVPSTPSALRLHDGDERVLDVGGPGTPDARALRRQHDAEEAGEELRLLYVALTRARSQVVVHWAPTANTPTSSLHRLLFDRDAPLAAALPVPSDEETAQRLAELAAGSAGHLSAETVRPAEVLRWSAEPAGSAPLRAARFTRTLDTAWRRTSYSALTAGAHDAAPAPPGVSSEPDVPVKDDEDDTDDLDPASAPPGAVPSPLSAFPGGRAFGTLVHEVLEEPDLAVLGERCAAAVAVRSASGVDPAALADGLRAVLETPLGDLGTTLAQTRPADRLAELAFELPLAGGDTPVPPAATADIAELLSRYDLGVLADYPAALAQLPAQSLRGFLTGSIDLLLRLPGPTYVVVDHKTNRLGPEPLTSWHYREEAMAEEMVRSHYVLQALLYAVATHRFLRWRQPGYDPDVHLGPVAYLFVRGMCGPASPPGSGVFTWQPPPGLVPALSDLLAGAP